MKTDAAISSGCQRYEDCWRVAGHVVAFSLLRGHDATVHDIAGPAYTCVTSGQRDSRARPCYTGRPTAREEAVLDPQEQLARHIVDVLEENRATQITLLDLRPDTIIADFFVICTATSERQIRALVGYVRGSDPR